MESSNLQLDFKTVKLSLYKAINDCSCRGLMQSVKWLSELNFAIKNVKVKCTQPYKLAVADDELDDYYLAKSFFDLKEYDRCAFYVGKNSSSVLKFLHYYSRFLSLERKKIDSMTELFSGPDPKSAGELQQLCKELRDLHIRGGMDAYVLYVFGVVLKRLDLLDEAMAVLAESITLEPLNWAAWLELSMLVIDRPKARSLSLPNHWMKQFYLGRTYLDQQSHDESLEILYALQTAGFNGSTYILAQIAIALHNKREVDEAIDTFTRLRKIDPYRLDNIDVLSNLYYVKEKKTELTSLAHQACEIDKYRVETCCVIGNYYSLRSDHQKAVLYFQRALRLNPQYLAAWTLMGHEYMEMKNTNAAIHSYRQAIEVNRRDYRAWYGLGQTYEILKMPYYCLYYYKQAQFLRPNDSRMLVALGETYERLEKNEEALKCFYKARNAGDAEGSAILKLAKLFDRLMDIEQAAIAFTEYVNENETVASKPELSHAYEYLANFHLNKNELELAYNYAQKTLNFEETKEEGKALLKRISHKRGVMDESKQDMQVEDSDPNDTS